MAFPDAYFRRGTSEVLFLPAVANTSAPTRAEITAGTNLTDAVQGISGWTREVGRVPLPNLGSRETFNLNGEVTYPASSLTLYDDLTDDTIRTTLAEDVNGFIVIMYHGDVPTDICGVFPVESDGPDQQMSLSDAALVQFDFGITGTVVRDAVIPAAV